jgi:anti-anti-sigma factor
VLEVCFEPDLSTASVLREALDAAVDACPQVVVDLGDVGFADCAGIDPLVHATVAARAQGHDVRLRHLPWSVERIIGAIHPLTSSLAVEAVPDRQDPSCPGDGGTHR